MMELSQPGPRRVYCVQDTYPKWSNTTAENVLEGCTEYVPYDTGALQASGATRQSGDKAYVEWGGDGETSRYARTQYYNALNHDTAQNALRAPRATDHWYDHAHADHGDEWNRVFGAAMKERL